MLHVLFVCGTGGTRIVAAGRVSRQAHAIAVGSKWQLAEKSALDCPGTAPPETSTN